MLHLYPIRVTDNEGRDLHLYHCGYVEDAHTGPHSRPQAPDASRCKGDMFNVLTRKSRKNAIFDSCAGSEDLSIVE